MHRSKLILCFVFTFVLANASLFGQFTDISEEFGFGDSGKAAFGDYNNDGFADLYTGKIWRNEGGK